MYLNKYCNYVFFDLERAPLFGYITLNIYADTHWDIEGLVYTILSLLLYTFPALVYWGTSVDMSKINVYISFHFYKICMQKQRKRGRCMLCTGLSLVLDASSQIWEWRFVVHAYNQSLQCTLKFLSFWLVLSLTTPETSPLFTSNPPMCALTR